MVKLYVIQLKKWKRWNKTIWTHGRHEYGGPVSLRSAMKALTKAQKAFPKSEYRIAVHRPRKKK